MSLSSEYIRTSLQSMYGDSVTSGDIRAWCAMNGANYQTVSKKIDEYKTSRGKWNLSVPEQLEQTYQAPPAMPAI
jgi:predicted restriction endonuclease